MLPGLQMQDAEDFSKMLGEKTYNEMRTSRGKSAGKGLFKSSISTNESLHTSARRLLTAEELRCLPDGVCLLYSTNLAPAYLETLFYKEPNSEAKTKQIGEELPVPHYEPIEPTSGKGKENTPASLAACIEASTGAKAEQVAALLEKKPQPTQQPANPKPAEKPAAKPVAEAEQQTVVRAKSGKVFPQVEQLDAPTFSVDDLYDETPDIEPLDYDSIFETEKAA
jgi:type IV secretory pathway TraG/TraD family ATPase VirD4